MFRAHLSQTKQTHGYAHRLRDLDPVLDNHIFGDGGHEVSNKGRIAAQCPQAIHNTTEVKFGDILITALKQVIKRFKIVICEHYTRLAE